MYVSDGSGRWIERSTCPEHHFFSKDSAAGRCRRCGVEMADAINEWSRARAIRAVVAAQWGVAMAQLESVGRGEFILPDCELCGSIATLPCAVSIVDGVA